MGSNIAPTYANLFMSFLEVQFSYVLHHFELVSMWWRYIDDIFVIWKGSQTELDTFFCFLNTIDADIKFTIEGFSWKDNFPLGKGALSALSNPGNKSPNPWCGLQGLLFCQSSGELQDNAFRTGTCSTSSGHALIRRCAKESCALFCTTLKGEHTFDKELFLNLFQNTLNILYYTILHHIAPLSFLSLSSH